MHPSHHLRPRSSLSNISIERTRLGTSPINFPEPQGVHIHVLQRPHIHGPIVREEIRIGGLSADAGAADCAEGVGDAFLAEGVGCHVVAAGVPGYVGFEGILWDSLMTGQGIPTEIRDGVCIRSGKSRWQGKEAAIQVS